MNDVASFMPSTLGGGRQLHLPLRSHRDGLILSSPEHGPSPGPPPQGPGLFPLAMASGTAPLSGSRGDRGARRLAEELGRALGGDLLGERVRAAALAAGDGDAQEGLEGTGHAEPLKHRAQDHGRHPDHHRHRGGCHQPQLQGSPGQPRRDDEDAGEHDRLGQVGGHGAAPHVGQQPLEAGQPVVRRRPTGVHGQDGEPAAASGQAQDRDQSGVGRPGLSAGERNQELVKRTERTQGQTTDPGDRQQTAVALGVGDEVGVGQAGPQEGGGQNHRGEGRAQGGEEPLIHIGHEPGQR